MRILIDECIDRRLRDFLPGHECQTARYAGFGGLENGALLTAAENAKFDVLLTGDRGIEFQQDLRRRNIAILIVYAKSIRLKDLLPHVATCLARPSAQDDFFRCSRALAKPLAIASTFITRSHSARSMQLESPCSLSNERFLCS